MTSGTSSVARDGPEDSLATVALTLSFEERNTIVQNRARILNANLPPDATMPPSTTLSNSSRPEPNRSPTDTTTADADSDANADAYECTRCENEYDYYEGYSGDHCSSECYYHDEAADIVTQLRYDHRYCATCYRKLKDVYPPGRKATSSLVVYDDAADSPGDDDYAFMKEDVPDCAIGRAYPRPHTVRAQAETLRPNHYDPDPDPVAVDLGRMRSTCKCGVTHHSTIERPITKDEAIEAAKHLSDAVDDLYRTGDHDHDHDRETLLYRVGEQKTDPEIRFEDQSLIIRALGDAILEARTHAPTS